MTTYRISQLAERSGVPATPLRFHETAGLLPAGRTASGYRVYGEDAVARLAFISSAKVLSLTLEEIRELLDVREEGMCASVRARMLPLTNRFTETDGCICELRTFSGHLAGVHDELSGPAPSGACGPDCGCTTTSTPEAGPLSVALSPTRLAPGTGPWRDFPGRRGAGDHTEQWQTLVGKSRAAREDPRRRTSTLPGRRQDRRCHRDACRCAAGLLRVLRLHHASDSDRHPAQCACT
ncbi:MerR family transcriptional regulator [Streptomyces kronopolitis]|uniref:MerR family transcriptional regulator n=1 Tax=Streptomyces kronopolitis TaxID=1612435 RepID=UPI0034166E8B